MVCKYFCPFGPVNNRRVSLLIVVHFSLAILACSKKTQNRDPSIVNSVRGLAEKIRVGKPDSGRANRCLILIFRASTQSIKIIVFQPIRVKHLNND